MSTIAKLITDFSDLYLNISPFGMFMVSVAYAGEAINIYTNNRWEAVFEIYQTFFAITILLVGIPATIYNAILETRKRKKSRVAGNPAEPGFVLSQHNTSAVRTFSFVFILLLAVDQFGPRIFPDMPPKFFLQSVISATLMFFSISFWIEMAKSNTDDSDE